MTFSFSFLCSTCYLMQYEDNKFIQDTSRKHFFQQRLIKLGVSLSHRDLLQSLVINIKILMNHHYPDVSISYQIFNIYQKVLNYKNSRLSL